MSVDRQDALLAQRAAERLAPVYEKHGWAWDPIQRVPTEADLFEKILERVKRVNSDEASSISSGRLVVSEGPFSDETGRDIRVYLEIAHAAVPPNNRSRP